MYTSLPSYNLLSSTLPLSFSLTHSFQVRFPSSRFLPESKLKELAKLLPPPHHDDDKMNIDDDPEDILEVYIYMYMVYHGEKPWWTSDPWTVLFQAC